MATVKALAYVFIISPCSHFSSVISKNSFTLTGTKHFLLMCNVKAEDAGEIRFVARDIESIAYLETEGKPIFISAISLCLFFSI